MSPNAEGGAVELWELSQRVQLYTGAQINFGDLTPYLTYGQQQQQRQQSIIGSYITRFARYSRDVSSSNETTTSVASNLANQEEASNVIFLKKLGLRIKIRKCHFLTAR
jgi:hypothetical protein